MAKKVLIEDLRKALVELEEKEKTPEVLAEIARIKGEIEKMEPKKVKESNFITCEQWKLEKKVEGGKMAFVRLKMVKETRLLPEQIDILNSQKENTKVEFVPKKQ